MQFSRDLLQTLERENPSNWKKTIKPLKNRKLERLKCHSRKDGQKTHMHQHCVIYNHARSMFCTILRDYFKGQIDGITSLKKSMLEVSLQPEEVTQSKV